MQLLAATNLSIGDVAGCRCNKYNANSFMQLGTGVGRKYPTTQAGGAQAWSDTGTTDIRITVTGSAATNAGSTRITFLYSQNNSVQDAAVNKVIKVGLRAHLKLIKEKTICHQTKNLQHLQLTDR